MNVITNWNTAHHGCGYKIQDSDQYNGAPGCSRTQKCCNVDDCPKCERQMSEEIAKLMQPLIIKPRKNPISPIEGKLEEKP